MKEWNNEQGEIWPARLVESPRPGRDTERSAELLQHERHAHFRQADAPIGVFDSGAGGLTILADLLKELPHEDFIYLGDTAHVPYGTRSDEEITALSLASCRYLMGLGV